MRGVRVEAGAGSGMGLSSVGRRKEIIVTNERAYPKLLTACSSCVYLPANQMKVCFGGDGPEALAWVLTARRGTEPDES